MAGMLPGVESARRRRFHQGGSTNSSTGSRRLSFCLYATGPEPHFSSTSFLQRSSFSKGSHGGTELGDVARVAKERLDERLRAQRPTEIKRTKSAGGGSGGGREGSGTTIETIGNGEIEMFRLKKCSRKKFCWRKMGWKSSEQRECAVCLDNFKAGDVLVHLPCAHCFHCACVMQWLESSSHCPCCRMVVFSQI